MKKTKSAKPKEASGIFGLRLLKVALALKNPNTSYQDIKDIMDGKERKTYEIKGKITIKDKS